MDTADLEVHVGERTLRKTTTLEFVERIGPRVRSIINLTGKSTTHRKAMFFMELLWGRGYRKQIHRKTLDSLVEMFLGGFRQTKQFYLGRLKVMGGKTDRRSIWFPGLLERLHYINRKGEFWLLNHEFVPLPYHYHESLEVSPDPPAAENSQDECQHSEVNAADSVKKISLTECLSGVACGEAEAGAAAPIENDYIQQQHRLRERNFQPKYTYTSNESTEPAPGPRLTEEERAEILKRDRKRLEISDRDYLPFLEKAAKTTGDSQ